ncbi:zinc finger, C2H2 type [Ancylostoma ceylanicum]|uniref:Zinc finger, C2H2 type n=1 Tax=Ancylostoma ceylanicum TaxID=53326 RepID=A0A0D6M1N4_9BILA|nr:zinc finger, C2H2 type [Ancylostoma ceylanicum]
MEIQAHLMHHNPYDIVKAEEPSTPPKTKTTLCPSTDMLFSVSNFNIQSNFCPQVNNNHDPLNNNHVKISSNGRTLAADRKRPYPCNLCTSRFGSKMELEEHQNSHTGMKPFECDVCKARFNRRSTLWNHKRIHSDAKPFVCTVCQMTFKWKNSLKVNSLDISTGMTKQKLKS